jgi:hypothetical protein
MPNRRYFAALLFVVALAFQGINCGSSSSMNSNRVLNSIAVTPATANAQGGQVQFTATGTFSTPPSPAVLTFASPNVGSFVVDPAMATIVSSNGGTVTVKCVSGASGTTTITANACAFATGTMGTCVPVMGSAKLTCP